jgi:N-acyl-D-amino-acid deacylase
MLDILIKNGFVVDGSGSPAFPADVAIAGGRIIAVGTSPTQDARRVINAQGLHVAPGFIDPHTHSDLTLLSDRRGMSKVRQGVTTEVICNCGSSPAPVRGAAVAEIDAQAAREGVPVSWRSMAEYLDQFRKGGVGMNVVPLVGHNTVRGCVLGFDDVQPSPAQQADMERLVADSMEQGARGLSTGLFYPPGFYAKIDEVIGLAKAAARYGGIYASHVRSESDLLIEAVSEAIEIGEKAGLRVEVAHVKLEGYQNWGGIDKLLAVMDEGVRRGVRLGFDQYPYVACSSWLGCILPYWAQQGGNKAVGERMRHAGTRAILTKDFAEHPSDWDNRSGVREWSEILIVNCPGRQEVEGTDVAEIARQDGKDALQEAFDLIAVSEGAAAAVYFDQLEDNVRTLMQHPLVVVGSDGRAVSQDGVFGERKMHPRYYGTFPRVLGRYVREENILTLEQAVRKMTSVTAERFGLTGRGMIRTGNWADVVIFDAGRVIDAATFADPAQYAVGIPHVIVNGALTIDTERHTGVLAGQVL